MPWQEQGSGYTTKRGGHVKDPAQYEALRRKGMSKERAARIVNKADIEKAEWTDKQMKRRRNLSSATGYVGSTIGLTALGATAVGSKVGGRALGRAAKLVPVANRAKARAGIRTVRQAAKKAPTPLLTAGAGVGGVGGLNFAAIQHQEAKRDKPKPKVVVVNNTTRKKLKVSDFAKSAPFNAEQRRHRRDKVKAGVLAAGSGAALAGAGYHANRARQAQARMSGLRSDARQERRYVAGAGQFGPAKAKAAARKFIPIAERSEKLARRMAPVRNARAAKAGALLAISGAGAVGAKKLADYEKSPRGRTYSPQYRPPKR